MSQAIEKKLAEQGIGYETNAFVQTTLLRAVAGLVVTPKNAEQVAQTLALLRAEEKRHYIIGGGSKSLILGTEKTPARSVIIKTKNLNGIDVNPSNGVVTAEAGATVCTTSRLSAKNSLTGMEFATDIPGSIAGAVATDAWHPIEHYADLFEEEGLPFADLTFYLKDILTQVLVVNSAGEEKILKTADLQMKDRKSILLGEENDWFLLNAVFQLTAQNMDLIERARKVISAGRKRMREKNKIKNKFSTQSTLGYTFVLKHPNYNGKSASELVATTPTLPKQIVVDGMIHSQETPNIVANMGNGNPRGYQKIADIIREAVLREHKIEMPLEVKVVN